MTEADPPPTESLEGQLEYHKRRYAQLESENRQLKERLASRAFLLRWNVVYEVDRSRGKDVPRKVLADYRGAVISDSWGAWYHIGGRWQRCLVHYLRELKDTVKYKNPGAEFAPISNSALVLGEVRAS